MKKLTVSLKDKSYDIVVGKGLLQKADTLFNLNRKVFIITDDGVPSEYAKTVFGLCKEAFIYTIPQGEGAKNIDNYVKILTAMIDFNMTRSDAVVAVGGGVVGDLSGFVASSYMRGVDFYNIPTTLLSMVDSSVGGKTAIDMHGVKNVVGAFYQPKGVIADVNLLTTLSKRQISNGLAESIKMSLTSDEKLFSLLESCDIEDNLEEIIIRSIDIKRAVVERDEKESGERKVLNFGHTLAHGIESANTFSDLYHGEAVAIGMVAVTNGEVKNRLISVLEKVNLPTKFTGDIDKALSFVIHDKKCKGDNVDVVLVSKIGSYEIKTIKVTDFTKLIKSSY